MILVVVKSQQTLFYWWQVSAGKACALSLKVPFKVLPNMQFPGSHSLLTDRMNVFSLTYVPVVCVIISCIAVLRFPLPVALGFCAASLEFHKYITRCYFGLLLQDKECLRSSECPLLLSIKTVEILGKQNE